MQLYIIRHAQSVNNALWARTGNDIGRDPDPGLTDIGQTQAQHLADYLATHRAQTPADTWDPHNRLGYDFTHLYTSLMERAIATGHAIATALDMPLLAWEAIHEWGGIYQDDPASGQRMGQPGATGSYLATHYPRLVANVGEEGWWNRPYEPREQAFLRAQDVVRELWQRHGQTNDRVALVTHGGFSFALYSALFGLTSPIESVGQPMYTWFGTHNTSLSRLDFGPDNYNLMYLNRVDHLPADLIT